MVIDNIRKRISLASSSHGAPFSANEAEDGFNGTEVSFPPMAWALLARLRDRFRRRPLLPVGSFPKSKKVPSKSGPVSAVRGPKGSARQH